MLEILRNIIGQAPAGCEPLEYAFCGILVCMVIILSYKFIISLIKNIFGKECRL